MSAQIERDFDFLACVYFQNEFLVNQYEFTLNMEVDTESIYEQNVAMDRLKYLIYECFENSVFVASSDVDAIEKYTKAGLKVSITPDDPYDQVLALLLLLKGNAVCEDRLKITDIRLTSKLSDGVKFVEHIETALNAIPVEGWWSNNNPSLCSKSQTKKGKVVKLVKDEWADLNLGWKEKKSKSAEVLFTTKKEDKPE